MLKAYKYRVYPGKEQREFIDQCIESNKLFWNLSLRISIDHYKTFGTSKKINELVSEFRELIKDDYYKQYGQIINGSLDYTAQSLQAAYQKFFKGFKTGVGFPKFKNRKNSLSFTFRDQGKPEIMRLESFGNLQISFSEKYFILPKIKSVYRDEPGIEKIKLVVDRPLDGIIKYSTISRTATGKYFIAVTFDDMCEKPESKAIRKNSTVGIDLGLKTFAQFSDGNKLEKPQYIALNHQNKFLRDFEKLQNEIQSLGRSIKNETDSDTLKELKLRHQKTVRERDDLKLGNPDLYNYYNLDRRKRILQKRLRNKKKGSSNIKKAYLQVKKIDENIRNIRQHHLQVLSRKTVDMEYDTFALEDLKVQNMVKNRKLARVINDAAWGEYKRLVKYKSDWMGKNVIHCGQFDASSKTCGSCGTINTELTLGQRVWECTSCGSIHDRDENAAGNIKTMALNKVKVLK